MKSKFPDQTRLMLVFAMGLAPLSSYSSTIIWEGDQDGNWSTDNAGDSNWSDDQLPLVGDTPCFGGVVNTTTNNDVLAATLFAGIEFINDGTVGTADAAFILTGNSITLGGNIITAAMVEGTLEDTIGLDLILDAERTIHTNPGHDLKVTGNISGAFTLNIGNAGGSGKGVVTLSGSNAQTLTDFERNGKARVESNTALGNSAVMKRGTSLFIADGLDLTLPGGLTVTNGGAPSQAIALNEPGAATASISASTTVTNQNYSQSANFLVGEEDTLTINGPLTGFSTNATNQAEIRKSGAGTLVLTNAANDYDALMRVLGGTLAISGGGLLGDSLVADLNLDGGNVDLGTTSQTVNAVIISDAYSDGDTIHNGSLSATSFTASNGAGNAIISANLLGGSGGFTKSGNGSVTLSGANAYTGITTGTAGTLIATAAAALPGYDSPAMVIFDGGTIGVQVGGAGWTSGELDTLLTNATKTSGTLGLDTTNGDFTLSGDFAGTIGLTKLGVNSLTLTGDNSYTGNTLLNEGTLNINSATALGDAASTFFIGGGTTIDNTSGSALTLSNNNAIILPVDGFTFGGTQDLDFGTGAVTLNLPPNNSTRVITLGGTGRTLSFGDSTSPSRGGNTNIQVDGPGNTLVFSSLGLNQSVANRFNTWSGSANVTVNGGVLDDGAQHFSYSGTGTFTIGGACTYAGFTTVNSGTLAIASGGSLSDETSVRLNGGTIDLAAGVNDTVASLTILGVNGDAALPDGEYGNTASGADNGGLGVGALDAYLTGSGKFVIDNGTPFDDWMAQFTTLSGDDLLPGSDPDFDGVDNFTEFAFDGNPEDGSNNGRIHLFTEDTTPTDVLVLTVAVRSDTGAWSGSGPLSASSPADGIDYSIGGTLDLVDFSAAVSEVTPVQDTGLAAPSAGYKWQSFQLDSSVGLSGKGFLRAGAAESP